MSHPILPSDLMSASEVCAYLGVPYTTLLNRLHLGDPRMPQPIRRLGHGSRQGFIWSTAVVQACAAARLLDGVRPTYGTATALGAPRLGTAPAAPKDGAL